MGDVPQAWLDASIGRTNAARVAASRGQRERARRTDYTAANNARLARGIHPATRVPLWIGTGERCGTCAHHQIIGAGNKHRLHKCAQHRLGMSASEASDIRVSWPACALYRPEAD